MVTDILLDNATVFIETDSSSSNSSSSNSSNGSRGEPPTPLHGANWRRPCASSSSINVRLLDAAVAVFAATFGYQVLLTASAYCSHTINMLFAKHM
jgi:hypothetical protein